MNVTTIPSQISDNFFFYVSDGGEGMLIDPVDAKTAIETVHATGDRLTTVFNTHWHPDHVAGNDQVLAAFPDAKLMSGPDKKIIANQTSAPIISVENGDTVTIGDAQFHVIATPGHTEGHVSLLTDAHLFCGDTVFSGGCGHCRLGGDVSVLYDTYANVLSEIPDTIRIYCGHDYSARNIAFILSLLPNDSAALRYRVLAEAERPFQTTMGQEREYNLFFRLSEPDLKCALADRGLVSENATEKEIFVAVRELRNQW